MRAPRGFPLTISKSEPYPLGRNKHVRATIWPRRLGTRWFPGPRAKKEMGRDWFGAAADIAGRSIARSPMPWHGISLCQEFEMTQLLQCVHKTTTRLLERHLEGRKDETYRF